MACYRNPWHRENERTPNGPPFYETDAIPTAYKGYLIYHRQREVWDVVKEDVCVAQMAGPNGARRWVDNIAIQ